MPRFVILEHDHPYLHWDFMLEDGPHLTTWRLETPPSDEPCSVSAERIGDHRLAYLDFEGPVSGGRGCVRRWDHGVYHEVFRSGNERNLHLEGARWQGIVRLQRPGHATKVTFEPIRKEMPPPGDSEGAGKAHRK